MTNFEQQQEIRYTQMQATRNASIALMQAVAVALGAKCIIQESDEMITDALRTTMVLKNGVQFFTASNTYGYKGKLHVSSYFPQHQSDERGATRHTTQRDFMPYDAKHFDGITCTLTKTAEQIAKDIQRRFLPVYEPMFAKALAYCDEQSAYFKAYSSLNDAAIAAFKPFGYASDSAVKVNVNYVTRETVRIEIDNLKREHLNKLATFLETL